MIVPSTQENGLSARLERLPTIEVNRWRDAVAAGDERRHITFEQADISVTISGSCWMTLEQFCEEVEARLSRWRDGQYLVYEAARILADAQGLTAEIRCKQMWDDASKVNPTLTIRLGGIPTAVDLEDKRRFYLYTVLQSDVNGWLTERRAGYALAYPYGLGTTVPTDDEASFQNAPEYQAKYARALEALDRMPVVKKEIQEWENALPDTVKDKQEKLRNLAQLNKELADLQELVNPGQSAQLLPVPPALPVVAAKRRTWRDVAMPYIVATYRAGKYKTAHTFYVELVNKVEAGNSPFTLHNRELFLTDLGQSVAEKTIANEMPKIKAAARQPQI